MRYAHGRGFCYCQLPDQVHIPQGYGSTEPRRQASYRNTREPADRLNPALMDTWRITIDNVSPLKNRDRDGRFRLHCRGVISHPNEDGLLHPIAFHSRKMHKAELCEIYDQRLSAIVYVYLHSAKSIVSTQSCSHSLFDIAILPLG